MDGMRMRTIASLLVLGLALWGPGMPLALAQVSFDSPELDTACRAEFATLPLDLSTECTRILDTCQAAEDPNATPEQKAEAAAVTGEAETVAKSLDTVANLETVPTDLLQKTLTQTAGVDPATAAQIAQEHSRLLEQAKVACGTGQVFDVERMVAQVQELYAKAGIDAKAVLESCNREYGTLSFDRVIAGSFETGGPGALGAPDFVGGGLNAARECYVTCDLLQRGGIEFQGAPPTPGEAFKMIEGMNVSADEKAKMFEMAKAYEGFCQEGNFAGIAENYREVVYRSFEQEMMEHGMSPEQIAQMEAARQTGDWTALEALRGEFGMGHGPFADYHQGPMPMEFYGPSGTGPMPGMEGMTFTPEMAAMMGSTEHYGSTSTGGTTFEAVVSSGGTTTTTETHNYDNTQQYNADREADGHAKCPAGTTHQTGVAEGPGHCQ